MPLGTVLANPVTINGVASHILSICLLYSNSDFEKDGVIIDECVPMKPMKNKQ